MSSTQEPRRNAGRRVKKHAASSGPVAKRPRITPAGPKEQRNQFPGGITAFEYEMWTDPETVTVPVPNMVHPTMRNAWKVHNNHPMCIIFDYVDPSRKYKRGEKHDDSVDCPFATYDPNPEEDPNVTDTDDNGDALQYEPIEVDM